MNVGYAVRYRFGVLRIKTIGGLRMGICGLLIANPRLHRCPRILFWR